MLYCNVIGSDGKGFSSQIHGDNGFLISLTGEPTSYKPGATYTVRWALLEIDLSRIYWWFELIKPIQSHSGLQWKYPIIFSIYFSLPSPQFTQHLLLLLSFPYIQPKGLLNTFTKRKEKEKRKLENIPMKIFISFIKF